MSFLVSTTEHEIVTLGVGVPSTLPERYGADILICTPRGLCGIQRKQFPGDFFASLTDGRLTRELSLMQQLEWRFLIPEGKPRFDNAGHLLSEGNSRWTQSSLRNLLRSVKIQHGVDVEWSDSIMDTVTIASELEVYLKKDAHRSLLTRPKSNAAKDDWGVFNRRDWARYFLQGFPSVGAVRAEVLFDHFGRVPLRWDCTKEQLMEVYGIGEKTATLLWGLFPDADAAP